MTKYLKVVAHYKQLLLSALPTILASTRFVNMLYLVNHVIHTTMVADNPPTMIVIHAILAILTLEIVVQTNYVKRILEDSTTSIDCQIQQHLRNYYANAYFTGERCGRDNCYAPGCTINECNDPKVPAYTNSNSISYSKGDDKGCHCSSSSSSSGHGCRFPEPKRLKTHFKSILSGSLIVASFLTDVYSARGIDLRGVNNLCDIKDAMCNYGIAGDIASSVASLATERAASNLLSYSYNRLNLSWYDDNSVIVEFCSKPCVSATKCEDRYGLDCKIIGALSCEINRTFNQKRMLNEDALGSQTLDYNYLKNCQVTWLLSTN